MNKKLNNAIAILIAFIVIPVCIGGILVGGFSLAVIVLQSIVKVTPDILIETAIYLFLCWALGIIMVVAWTFSQK